MGYKIVYLSNINPIRELGDVVNENNDFNILLNYLKYCEFFIGVDCGDLHISQAFEKFAFVINGAALSSKTSYSKKIYSVTNKNLTCLCCKSRQFLNDNGQGGVTFVSHCELPKDKEFSCMKDITSEYLLSEFINFKQRI